MNKTHKHENLAGAFLLAILLVGGPALAGTLTEPLTVNDTIKSTSSEEPDFLAGHLQIGTRITGFMLLKDKSDSFIGSIDQLDEEQDLLPTKLYADWYFSPYWGLDLTWDHATAKTATQDKTDTPTHSDGSFKISGPIISLIGRYPNPSDWIPYGGAGVAIMSARFDAATWWYTGFPSESDWEEYGSPSQTLNGLNRVIEPKKNAIGYVAFGGCDYKITDHLLVGAYVRYMNIKLDAHYYLTINGVDIDDRGDYSIPMHNMVAGIGTSYLF